MNFNIRAAIPGDEALILSFIKKLAEFEQLSHEVVATADDLKNSLFGERPYAEVLIGEEGGKPVAFALFFHNYSTFLGRPGLYLEDLFVDPDYRGRQYGQKMLQRLRDIANERQCGRMEWWVLDWNTKAIDFYRRLGANPMDEWTTFRLDPKHSNL